MLAGGGGGEVGGGVADAAEVLEPKLGVLFFIQGRFLEEGGDLLVAVLLGAGGEVVVFVAGLGFAGEGEGEVGGGFRSFEFHGGILSVGGCFGRAGRPGKRWR